MFVKSVLAVGLAAAATLGQAQTATYAITIEPKGGSQSPSLDKLIGTMGVL